MVIQMVGAGDQAAVAYRLSVFFPYAALVWAAGGWSVTRTAAPLAGALVLAVVGLVSGFLLAYYGLAPEPRLLISGAFAGLLYGFLGGLILGRILSAPPPAPAEEP